VKAARNGDVTLEPKQTWVECWPVRGGNRRTLEQGVRPVHTTARRARSLLAAEGPLPDGSVKSSVVRELEEAGTVYAGRPGMVELLLQEVAERRISSYAAGSPISTSELSRAAGEAVDVRDVTEATGPIGPVSAGRGRPRCAGRG